MRGWGSEPVVDSQRKKKGASPHSPWYGKGEIQVTFVRAIGICLLVFAASLVICGIGSKALGIDLETADPARIPVAMWYIGILSAAALSGAGTWWLFKSTKTAFGLMNGFLFGLLAVVLGIALDGLALIPHQNGLNILLRYFAQPQYWMAFVSILATCTFVGYVGKKYSKRGR
jgi:hypothetical protein